MNNTLTLKLNISKFKQFILDNFEKTLSIDNIILEALNNSLECDECKLNNTLVEKIILSNSSLKNFYEDGCKVKEIVLYVDIDNKFDIQNIELNNVFSKLGNFEECYPYSYIKIKNRQMKRPLVNRVKIVMTNITISRMLFNDLYLRYKNECLSECHFLQDSVNNWYGLVLKECKVCGQRYYCDCSQKTYDAIFKELNKNGWYDKYDFKKYGYSDINSQFVYEYKNAKMKHKCCDLCCKTIPSCKYDLKIFSNKFEGIYFYYIQKKGVELCLERNLDILDVRNRDIKKEAEEYIRDIVDYPKNKKWVSETYLYTVIKTLFSNYRIEREYSPPWLNKMRIDIYIHTLNIGIEYQGQQHYKPVDIFGGEESFIKGQERDKLKKQLCKENGLKLIYFKYNEILTEDAVLSKIKKAINK